MLKSLPGLGLTGTLGYILRLWRECSAHGDLYKYQFYWSGKFLPRTPFSKENVPLNKQTKKLSLDEKDSSRLVRTGKIEFRPC